MARRILTLLLLLSTLFAFEYEVIKNIDGNDSIVTIYLDNKEMFSLIGDDTRTFKEAYSFISKMIQYNHLGYDSKDIMTKALGSGTFGVYYGQNLILGFTNKERVLNEKRGNSLEQLRRFAQSIQYKKAKKIILSNNEKNGTKIRYVTEVNIAPNKKSKYFPAIHEHLALGTKIRILNTKTDWSVVVQIVKNQPLIVKNGIGLNHKAIEALGIDVYGEHKIRAQFL